MKKTYKKAFALYLSVLVASLLSAIGSALYFIASKEFEFSYSMKESQKAFYVADTAAECALFLNFYHNAFATSTEFTDTAKIKCAGNPLKNPQNGANITKLGGSSSRGITIFQVDIPVEKDTGTSGGNVNYCAVVRVRKFIDSQGYPRTYIDSRGYNISCNERMNPTDSTKNRLLERAVLLQM